MGKNQSITKEMTVAQVVENFPEAASILLGYGFHCAGCPAAKDETIEDLAKVSQLDLEKLLDDLNKAIK